MCVMEWTQREKNKEATKRFHWDAAKLQITGVVLPLFCLNFGFSSLLLILALLKRPTSPPWSHAKSITALHIDCGHAGLFHHTLMSFLWIKMRWSLGVGSTWRLNLTGEFPLPFISSPLMEVPLTAGKKKEEEKKPAKNSCSPSIWNIQTYLKWSEQEIELPWLDIQW